MKIKKSLKLNNILNMLETRGYQPRQEPPPIPPDARRSKKIGLKTPPTIKEPVPSNLGETQKISVKELPVKRHTKTIVESPPIWQERHEQTQALEIPSIDEIFEKDLEGLELINALGVIASDKDAAFEFLVNINELDPKIAVKVLENSTQEKLIRMFKKQVDVKKPAFKAVQEREVAGRRDLREVTNAPDEVEKRLVDELGIAEEWRKRGQVADFMSKEEVDKAFNEILNDPDVALKFVMKNTDKTTEEINTELKDKNIIFRLLEKLSPAKVLSGEYSPALRDMVSKIINEKTREIKNQLEREAIERKKRLEERTSSSQKKVEIGLIFDMINYVTDKYKITPQKMREMVDYEKLIKELNQLGEDERKKYLDDIFGSNSSKPSIAK